MYWRDPVSLCIAIPLATVEGGLLLQRSRQYHYKFNAREKFCGEHLDI